MTLMALLIAGASVIGVITSGMAIGMSIEDGKDGAKGSLLVGAIVITIYSLVTTLFWLVAKGAMA